MANPSPNVNVTWTSPSGSTGSGTLTDGGSINIPIGSQVVCKLATPTGISTWSMTFQSDNASVNNVSIQAYASAPIQLTLPLALSLITVETVVASDISGNASARGTIVNTIQGQVSYSGGLWTVASLPTTGQTTVSVSNGLNSNIATSGNQSVLLQSATGAFSIGGFSTTSPQPGQALFVQNTTTQTMTIVNEDASSTAAYRIRTQSGFPVVVPAGRPGTLCFIYNGTTNRWDLQNIGLATPPFVNAKDFCAGDGVTADGANMNNALIAAAGGQLHIPAGTYYLDATMYPQSSTRVTGEGAATVLLTQYGMRIQAVNDVSMENVTVNMLVPQVAGSGAASTTTSFQAIAIINGSQRVTVKACLVKNFSQFGIVVGDLGTNNGCNDIRILDNIVDCTNMTTASLANDPIGIECFPKGTTSSFAVTPGLIIHGNTVLGPTIANSILAGIKCSVENGVRITDNFVNNILLNTIPEGGIDILNCAGAVIQGNKVDNCTIGISVGSLASGPSLLTTSEVVVSDNVVSNYVQYGMLLSLGINGLAIEGNHFTSTTSTHGIYAGAWNNAVNSCVSSGGLIELGFAAAPGFTNGQNVLVTGVGGVSAANGYWTITVVDSTHCTLNGSTFSGSYTSGGNVATVYKDLVIADNRLNGAVADIYVLGPAPNYVITGNLVNGGQILATDHHGVVSNNVVNLPSTTAVTITGNGGVCSGNAINAGGATGINVTGNTVTVCGNSVTGTSGYNITVNGNDSTISSNSCNGSGTSTYNVYGVGNNIVVSCNSLLSASGGVGVSGPDGIVTGNSIRLSGLYGVQVVSGNNQTICGNRIIDPNTSNTAGGSGISVGASTFAEVYNNHIENRTASGLAFYGISYSGSNMLMRDNRIVNVQTQDVLSSSPGTTYTMSQETYVDCSTSSAPADTNEDTLKTVTFDAGSLGINGGFRMKAAGNCSGAGGTKTVKLYLAATPFTVNVNANAQTWSVDATVFNNGTESTQTYDAKQYTGPAAAGVLQAQQNGTGSFLNTATTASIIKVTGKKASAGDDVTCNMLMVERFQ